MFKADVVIIDSGVSYEVINSNEKVESFSLCINNNKILIGDNAQDEIGHGTAIYSIISKYAPSAKILNIKIFDKKETINEDTLYATLCYIRDNINCKIINLSCGLKYCVNEEKLEEVCNQIYRKGTIIVSAFDNEGCLSFPATFKCVIGVDGSSDCINAFEFEYIEGDKINVRAKGGFQRIKWKDGKNILLGGSSFACAYVTAYCINICLNNNWKINFEELLAEIKKKSVKIYNQGLVEKKYTGVTKNINIKCAALFPFNKEMHSLVRYANDLGYKIESVYDIRQLGRIGINTRKILKQQDDCMSYIIEDIRNIDCSNIDCLILGHLEEVNRVIGRDIRKEMFEYCINNNINVYSFDSLEYCLPHFKDVSIDVFWPSVNSWNVPKNTFGKMYGITKPVVGFFGTSSKQGKFTLQMCMKKLLERMDYKVGGIGTEPQALLCGMDYVYPMGYNSSIFINDHESVLLLNEMSHEMCNKYDIIMVGAQANTIPYNYMNVCSFHAKQHSFLIGTQPDIVVLCVNFEDDIEYISNTIKYIEGCINCKVIATVLFPLKLRNDWRGMFESRITISDNEYNEISAILKGKLNVSVYRLDNYEDMLKLRDSIIYYFGS